MPNQLVSSSLISNPAVAVRMLLVRGNSPNIRDQPAILALK